MSDPLDFSNLLSKNYFEIFDVTMGYEVDMDAIGELYHDLQKQLHPDRFASDSEQQRRLAMQQTSLVNQAFQTLKDPLQRAQYLLSLKGIDMSNDTDTSMDGAFLMEQMEFREAIAEVRSQGDPVDVLDGMLRQSKQNIKNYMDEFAQLYANDQLQPARDSVRKMQFLFKAQQEITALLEQLEDELL